jgi:O-methyltransferase
MPEEYSRNDLAAKYLQAMKVSLTGTLLKTPKILPNVGNASLLQEMAYDEAKRVAGEDWPKFGLTMVGEHRLDNIHDLFKRIIQDDVPGDFVECGVWRGGASMYAKAVVEAYAPRSRRVHLVDSFEGLPKSTTPTPVDNDLWSRMDYLKVGKDDIADGFKKLGLLNGGVLFHKGYFRYSAARLRDELHVDHKGIALLRMDGDMYESTMDILYNLYDLVPASGCVIVDDWTIPECRRAIEEFRTRNKVHDEVVSIDDRAVFWCKSHAREIDQSWYNQFNASRKAEYMGGIQGQP